GQRLQEGDNGSDLVARERTIELGGSHLSNRVAERRRAAIMEVRGRRRYVAQARHPDEFRLRAGKGTKDAVPLEEIATDIDPLMAGDAAERLEQAIAFLLLGTERRALAAEPAVEPASRRQQTALVRGDRVEEARSVRRAPIGRAE